VLLAMLMGSVSAMPVVLASYRERRILRRIATTPVRPHAVLAAQYGIYGAAATIGGAISVLIGWLAYGVELPQNLVGFILVFLLVLAASLSIGGLISSLAPNGKIATAVGTAVLFPLMFTAGVWLPVQAMPGLLDVGVVAAWTALLSFMAARFFRWE
jgi:ABC-2 type transport system permease protein